MQHIFNLTKIKELMLDEPHAQRLQNLFNKDRFDTLSEDQVNNVIEIIESKSEEAIKAIIDNVPYKISR